jgi:pimeloyl-ACP methyl ester carboxylesterase
LAGLSNGGVGVSELAPRLAGQLDGLLFISGVNPEAENCGLPVLLLHGLEDERMPASLAANYAARIGSNATYVLMVGDHFLAAKRAETVQETIAGWLAGIWEQ